MIKLCGADAGQKVTMHDKAINSDPDTPACTIATDNLWIHEGSVRLCPYFPAIGNLITGTATLKQLWNSSNCRQLRRKTRACRRLCNISCLRRTPLLHKVRTFLQMS